MMDAGFDQIFNLYNEMVYSVGDIIDTYVTGQDWLIWIIRFQLLRDCLKML
jgi:ABC-type polysaccharide transport system permease subunit